MIDTIYFFASKEDICHIFNAVEQEFDVKYCKTSADKEAGAGEMPKMEFDTIGEIADDCHGMHSIQPFYLIAPKTEIMKIYRQALKDRDDIERYRMDYPENGSNVMLKGMQKHEDLTCDYYVHIARELETEFSGMLFKKIVREVKRNCVKITYGTPIYIGKELYKSKDKLVFSGGRCGAFTLTETDEVKQWYRSPKVREFADRSFTEQLSFLRDVFSGRELVDFTEERKKVSEGYQDYLVAMSQPWGIKDLSLLKEVFALFDDEIKMSDGFTQMQAMEKLCEASVYVAAAQRPDGIRVMLDSLCFIPENGRHCGREGIIRILLKKKYFERFRDSLADVREDTKVLVRNILEDITDKRTVRQREELADMLEREVNLKKEKNAKG